MGERRERTAARTWAIAGLTLLLAANRARAVGAPAESTPAATRTLASALGDLLRADAGQVGAELDAVPAHELDAEDAKWRSCVRARLAGQHAEVPRSARGMRSAHGFAARALTLYRDYWRVSAIDPSRRETAERKLLESLTALLGLPEPVSWDEAEPLLAARLERDRLHSLEGQTGRLRELMIWAKVEDRTQTVELPEQTVSTRVFYLEDFVSLGWGAYLTCDRAVTGGWTKPDALYAVVPGYASLEDETFRVSFLAHESQHFADLRRFPALAGWELEFRAKLVELTFAAETKDRILASFASNQSADPAEPHSFANTRVLAALRARLEVDSDAALAQVEVDRLHRAASEELRADTARRTTTSAARHRRARRGSSRVGAGVLSRTRFVVRTGPTGGTGSIGSMQSTAVIPAPSRIRRSTAAGSGPIPMQAARTCSRSVERICSTAVSGSLRMVDLRHAQPIAARSLRAGLRCPGALPGDGGCTRGARFRDCDGIRHAVGGTGAGDLPDA